MLAACVHRALEVGAMSHVWGPSAGLCVYCAVLCIYTVLCVYCPMSGALLQGHVWGPSAGLCA